jgi:hypothetical protein
MALKKSKRYARTKFSPEVLREAHRRLGPASKIKRITLDVEDGKRNDARAPKAIFPLLFAFAEIYKPA